MKSQAMQHIRAALHWLTVHKWPGTGFDGVSPATTDGELEVLNFTDWTVYLSFTSL